MYHDVEGTNSVQGGAQSTGAGIHLLGVQLCVLCRQSSENPVPELRRYAKTVRLYLEVVIQMVSLHATTEN